MDDMLAVNEWQENHPSGVVGEDDQANGDKAKSYCLVCPGGLEKNKGSAGELRRDWSVV